MIKRNICVFCGASSGSTPDFRVLAEKIGKLIGENDFNLIYGAGSTGLMGACAKSAKKYGANVFGVMPNFLARVEKRLDDINGGISFASSRTLDPIPGETQSWLDRLAS